MQSFPKNNFVFLETNRFDRHNSRSYLFTDAARTISCYKPKGIRGAFLELEYFLSRGYYAAGFISYEAGFSFEDSLKAMYTEPGFPLLWFGIYKDPIIFNHREKINLSPRRSFPYAVKNLRPNISRNRYLKDLEKIKAFIRNGETYQVNYTFKYKFDFSGSVLGFYEGLKSKQSVSYSALIKTGRYSVVSLSPELFFRMRKGRIEVRPMKGTLGRGRDLEGDRHNMKLLSRSAKDRSENLMIVDLLRNDLGRICRPGSVRTDSLFEVERYETLLQMISVVKGRLKKDISVYDLFCSIFPSGSVTGAPKIKTMQIINSLEKEQRLVYTGGIGFFAPGGGAVFNVAIRTAVIDNKTKKGEMGIGSGVVIDSDPCMEFEECRLKADFISKRSEDFKLIETMLLKHGRGYFLLGYHLDRLKSSAGYFNFQFDRKCIIKGLKDLERGFDSNYDYRIRLLLDRTGKIGLTFSKLDAAATLPRVGFSDKKTFPDDIFLYHKTTNRGLYNKEYEKWKRRGCFDIIFSNEKDQITEGAISNIIIKKGRSYYTPPVECGLLNGVYRRHLFERSGFPLKEKVLYKRDVESADGVYMLNSVRGMIKVRL